jgi:molybdopterin/thiamine biosynthesis adenylyltransferase
MNSRPDGRHLVVVGAGNIGSHLIPHLGRMDDVGRVTIIDRDSYEESNIPGQDIVAADVGRPKADVQARRLQRIRPDLAVTSIHAPLEDLPPGRLHGDAILAGVDNRRARQRINEVAWQLGVPWIDAAVDGAGWLVRIAVYVPGPDLPCLECGWNSSDYDALEQDYPCLKAGRGSGAAAIARTNAPSALGAVAAGLQALECRALLDPATAEAGTGRQVFADLRYHQYYCTVLPRNPQCRRASHEAWRPVAWDVDPRNVRLGDLLAGRDPASSGSMPGSGRCELRVNDLRWIRRFVCSACGAARGALQLSRGSLLSISRRCPGCGGRMYPLGLELAASLSPDTLSATQAGRSLHALGVRPGDIVTLQRADGTVSRGRITG